MAGVGFALAHSPAVAVADDTPSRQRTSESSRSAGSGDRAAASERSDTSGQSRNRRHLAPDEDATAEDAPVRRTHRRTTVTLDDEPAVEPDGDADPAPAEPPGDEPEVPADPASTALWTLAGTARRDAVTDTAPSVSPLGTEQQLEAERIATRIVHTLPVQLMKAVLRTGWLATARREYRALGGIDRTNLDQLGRAVDEYAMAAAFQQQLLNPMRPTVVAQVAPPHSWYGMSVPGSRILYDNPDTIYRFMGVNKTSTYVITGRVTGAPAADLTFSVLTGLSGVTADILTGRQLQLEPDGSFTVTVSGAPAAPGQTNHLQLTNDTTLIAVRDTLSQWEAQVPMELAIERVSGPPNSLFSQLGGFAIPLIGPTVSSSRLLTTLVSLIPPLPVQPTLLRGTVTAAVMALGLSMEAKYIKVATTDPATGQRLAPNEFRDPSRNAEFLATQLQSAGYFALTDRQALVLTVAPGNAGYFTVPVTNLWTITDNYWDQQTSLNNAQAEPNDDGTYTFVISSRDPGVHNWVSTGGLNQGTISIRFQDLDPESDAVPTVRAVVVDRRRLPTVLPADTRYLTRAQRSEQLALRRAGFDVRFAPFPQ
ncbi:hypothetical protein CRI77_10225 [Mycolicibacterium duvalii]|nr:DUF1214 domain-containing protein [Mycolicibacterium duvalii]MCV7366687.1 DUF1214 domain-containing protein [Mycolicibacterium duvalii]PEG41643.1 hypothetical protein CRI77_10225 [Mycolicibacterium duvalii]